MSTVHAQYRSAKRPSSSRKNTADSSSPKSTTRPDTLGGFYAAGPAVALGGAVQRKVAVGKAGDRYEREADSVAERVDRGQTAPAISHLPPGGLGTAQRMGGEDEPAQSMDEESAQSKSEDEPESSPAQAKEDEPAQSMDEEPAQSKEEEPAQSMDEEPAQSKSEDEPAQSMDEEPAQSMSDEEPAQSMEEEPAQSMEEEPAQSRDEEPAQEKPAAGARPRRADKEAIAGKAIHSRGPGEPLDEGVRGTLEQGMGVDLGDVRVHRDARAQQAAKGMKAKAFTHKNNIWLGPGQSAKDTKLMAHEATHVVQQGGVDRSKSKSAKAGAGPAARVAKAGGLPVPGAGVDATAGSVDQAAAAGPLGGSGVEGGSATAEGPVAEPAADATSDSVAGSGDAAAGSAGDGSAGDGAAGEGDAGDVSAEGEGKDGEATRDGDGKKKAGGPGAAGGAGGPGGAAADEEGPAVGEAGGATPWIDPGAAAAAEKRKAADRRNRKGVEKKADAEAKRQQGPAARPTTRRAAAAGAASAASEAALSPPNEATAMGQADHAETLGAQEPGKVDQKSFLDMVDEKLRKMDTPGSVEEMKDFKKKGGAAELKAQTVGGAKDQAAAAQKDIRGAAETQPAPAAPRETTELKSVPPPPDVDAMKARKAAPKPMAKEEVSLDGSKKHVEERMKKERLSKKRLEKANDPRFSSLQGSREEVHDQSDRAPKEFRQDERSRLAGDKAALSEKEQATGVAMQTVQGTGQKKAREDQQTAKSQEETERKKISDAIEKKYQAVEKKVQDKLTWLDGEVDRLFDDGEKKARQQFETYVSDAMFAWKLRRYGSRAAIPVVGAVVAAGTWAYDKLRGIDHFPEVQNIFKDGRDKYLKGLRDTIVSIAGVVEKELAWCKTEIGKARDEIRDFVANLPKELQKVGAQAAADVLAKLDDLKDGVEAKKEELADKLVERYKASREKIDARIEEMRAENRGLVEQFVGKLKAVLEAIDNFRKKLLGILGKARDVIEDILDDPIGFLKNLLRAVQKGFQQFKENIGAHLKKGLFGWLFGTLASAGVQLPKDFSLKSIIGLILQVLGITYEKMKKKVSKLIGPRATAVLEKVAGYLGALFREGPAGLWKEIKQDLGNLKDFVLDQIKDWLITKIVKAAVTKLASMFNPVGAIVQAVLTIYNVVMFFIERIDQILQLVKAVVDALAPIVKGKIAQAANAVEKAMGLAVPVIISFLARLLGLGGIAGKIQKIVKKVQRRVDRAIDKALKRIVARFKSGFAKGKAAVKKGLAKFLKWWTKPKKFKVKGKSHKVFFKGKKLRVASREKDLAELAEELQKLSSNKFSSQAAGAEREKQRAEIAATAGALIQLKDKVVRNRDSVSSAKRKKQREAKEGTAGAKEEAAKLELEQADFNALIEKVKVAMKLIAESKGMEGGDIPKTEVKASANQQSLGERAVAAPLIIKGSGGSAPGGRPTNTAVWKAVRFRKSGGSTYYKLGHLVAQKLHGKGSDTGNITPISGSANSSMASGPEKSVKKYVWNQGGVNPKGLPVRYEVNVKYEDDRSAKDAQIKDVANPKKKGKYIEDEEKRKVVINVLEKEKLLASKLEFTASLLPKPDATTGGDSITLSDPSITNVVPSDIPDVGQEGVSSTPNLNLANRNELKSAGVNEIFANEMRKEIRTRGEFSDRGELEDRMLNQHEWELGMVTVRGERVPRRMKDAKKKEHIATVASLVDSKKLRAPDGF